MEQARKGIWESPWAYINAVHYRAKDGTKRSKSDRWREIICNDPECDAAFLVRESDILSLMPWDAFDTDSQYRMKL